MKKIRAYNCTELLEVYPSYAKAYSHVIYNNLLYSTKGREDNGKLHLSNTTSVILADSKDVRSVAGTKWRKTFDHDKSTEVAIDWWNTLSSNEKYGHATYSENTVHNLTNQEIGMMYSMSTKENLKDSESLDRPQVDFEALKNFIKTVEEQMEIGQEIPHPALQKWGELENYKLFIKMIGKSSSFAHKAHKELKAIGKNEDQIDIFDSKTDAQATLCNADYKFRNLPYSGCKFLISGVDELGVLSGILEWCTDEDDVINMFEEMKKYPQFSDLKMVQLY